ncbi:MAG: tetratricopeptide repeat protein [Silvibacterium sp.]|nr:tetratricopeptide repeat protein [Silvibacterium sp.]
MKKILFTASALLLALFAHGQSLSRGLTPAEQQIAWSRSAIQAHPDKAQPYNDLAVAYIRRARETGDSDYLNQAEAALKESAKRVPGNFEGEKAHAMILLARDQFAKALQFSRMLNQKTPDDTLTYGFIADAATALGDYAEAERATQWMLDLREGNVPGLLRAARLRVIYGDTSGALDFYSQAYQQIPPTQTEDQAWTLTQMAEIQLSTGHLDEAESLLQSALQKFPGYYLTLGSYAGVETARHHYKRALDLLRQRDDSSISLSSRYVLASALECAGESAEAASTYKDFELKALKVTNEAANANRELVLYYLGRGNKPAEALHVAEHEVGKRHDVFTLDAYAWALCANGRYGEAKKQVDTILSVGIRDAAIFYHAGAIAERLNDHADAVRYLNQSLELNPESEVAVAAHDALAKAIAASAIATNNR